MEEPLSSNNTQRGKSNTENVKYDPKYAPLYKALRIGDWNATKRFLDEHEEAKTARISTEGKTPLHVAALFGHSHIVEKLLQILSKEDVELLDFKHLTALHETSYTSHLDIAECLVKHNRNLLEIPSDHSDHDLLPVTRALSVGQIEMARYLYSETPNEVFKPENGTHGATLLKLCYYSHLLDIALHLLDDIPSLAVAPDDRGETFLEALASIPSAFPSRCQISFWQRWIYYNWIDIPKEDLRKVQHKTIPLKSGNVNISLSIPLPETSPSQSHRTIMHRNKNNDTMVSSGSPIFAAVKFRQARVFSLIYGMNWKNAVANLQTDDEGNTLLHMAGLLDPSTQLNDISGAALQMQRELQWFKAHLSSNKILLLEVESMTPSFRKETQNNAKLTARQLFTENHKELVKQGEKWMKGTARSCSVVAALAATIVFSAAFSVPGSNNQDTGYPILSKKRGFMVFIISDAISLFSSTTSIIMFLGILTSRYAEDDFLMSLPTKLIIGLFTLFVSMATMLIAFCAALLVMLHGKLWIVIPVSVLAAVPIASFLWLQFPLLVEMAMSTYWPRIFDRNVKPWLMDDLITIGPN